MNNIDIFHEQLCRLPLTTWTFAANIIYIYREKIDFSMNNVAGNNMDFCREQHLHLACTTLTFSMNNIDICRE
jgi:hypothetical protein